MTIQALATFAAPFFLPRLPVTPSLADAPLLVVGPAALALRAAAPHWMEHARRITAPPPALHLPLLWCVALALSLIFQLNAALIIWLVGRALGLDIGLTVVLLCPRSSV